MADNTPDYALSGILVPRKFSTTLAADYLTGTDYTEADRKPGAVTFSGTAPRLTLEATGDIDSTTTSEPSLMITRGGMPGPGGAGFVYRYGTSGDWYGADAPLVPTYIERVVSSTRSYQVAGMGGVVLSDGTLVVVGVAGGATNQRTLTANVRTTAGVWSNHTIKSTTHASTIAGCSVAATCVAPDGSIHAYWPEVTDGAVWTMSHYRSTDGQTWYLQTTNVSPWVAISASTTHLRAATINGSVVLFGGSTASQQYVSSDGGYSFETVGGTNNNAEVMGLVAHHGYLHALVADNAGTKTAYHYRIASGGVSLWDATATSMTTCDESAGGFIVATPYGLLAYYLTSGSPGKAYAAPYRSVDGGATWAAWYGPQNNTPALVLGAAVGLWCRGRLHIVGSSRNATTGLPSFSPSSDDTLLDMVFGGHSTVPIFSSDAWSGMEWSAPNRRMWIPLETLAASGWAAADTGGAPVRTVSEWAGLRIQTGTGVTAINTYADSATNDTQSDQLLSVNVVAGIVLIITESRPVSLSVYITPTTIAAVETGGSPSYTSHSISGAIEVRISVDGSVEKGRVWYRADDGAGERAWTALGSAITLSTTSYTTATSSLRSTQDSDVYWKRVYWRNQYMPPLVGIVEMDTTAGTAISMCPVSATDRTYIGSGMYLRGRGGPARYDTATYTVSLGGSRYGKSHLLPTVSPSPRAPWRSSGTTTQTLKFTVEPETGTETEWMSGTVGIYLDNLVNVSQFTLKNSGSTISAVDLRTSFVYTHDTGVIYPAASGGAVSGVYVAEGSLIGCQFAFADGKVRDIVDNTGGVLTSGSSVGEKRCRIRVDGLDGTEDTTGTGYIWPKRAFILYYLRGTREVTQLQIEIASGVAADALGYRQIGTVAIGEVSVFGRAFDRTTSNEYTAGTSIFDASDGGSVASITGPMQRTMEVAFVESPTFLGQVRDGGNPNYVTTSASGSALPAATEFGVPMTAEGIYRRTDGGFLPVVPIRRIPRDSGAGSALYVSTIGRGAIAEGTFLARITGSIRREQIQVGQAMVDDAERVATISFREIV